MAKTKTKKKKKKRPEERIGLMFLDSGAHSLYTKYVINQNPLGRRALDKRAKAELYKFYTSKEFFEYVDAYCNYVKENRAGIDYFVNVDAIFNPEITWDTQQYIEKEHGLRPVPVVHHGTPYKWIARYIEAGHDFIGLGGLGQEVTTQQYYAWADEVYSELCPASNDYKPIVRTHGFAMTAWKLLIRYPWWSVDSASWVKSGGFGMLYVPRQSRNRKGKLKFDFTKEPYSISISATPPNPEKEENQLKLKQANAGAFWTKDRLSHPAVEGGKSFHTQPATVQRHILNWLEHVGIPLGSVDEAGQCVEKGVVSHHSSRKVANLHFFHAMQQSLPEWPWPFRLQKPIRKGFF